MADKNPQEESDTGEAAKRCVSTTIAREAASRFIDWYFDNPGCARPKINIPASPNDDDLLLVAYIEQGAASDALLKRMAEALAVAETAEQHRQRYGEGPKFFELVTPVERMRQEALGAYREMVGSETTKKGPQ